MSVARLTILSMALAVSALAADVAGSWKGTFLGPIGDQPKTVGSMSFDLKSDGTTVTGNTVIGSWPGKAPVTEGTIEGNRITFTVTNNLSWKSSYQDRSASGYPRLTFTGTIDGDEMRLTLVWDSIMIYGDAGEPREYKVVAKRQPAPRAGVK